MVCNESSDCSTATDLLNFVRPIIAVSKLSTLRLHFAHLRFAERRHLSTLYPTERLSLMLVFPGYLFFTNQYYMVAISHRGSAKAAHRCYFTNWATYCINFVRAHAPK